MTPRPMEARNPDARAMRADPTPVVADKPPSPWAQHTAWIADPSAAPVEYLEPLRELGFTQLCVRATHGADVLAIGTACIRYRVAGWDVVLWGRVDQRHNDDVREDPVASASAVAEASGGEDPFAHNIEIRWDDADNKAYSETKCLEVPEYARNDAICTYPGGMPDKSHAYYQQAGVRVALIQPFIEVPGGCLPHGMSLHQARQYGLDAGYEISIPLIGVFHDPNGNYANVARQREELGDDPIHAYLTEQSGWRFLTGQGYDWDGWR